MNMGLMHQWPTVSSTVSSRQQRTGSHVKQETHSRQVRVNLVKVPERKGHFKAETKY